MFFAATVGALWGRLHAAYPGQTDGRLIVCHAVGVLVAAGAECAASPSPAVDAFTQLCTAGGAWAASALTHAACLEPCLLTPCLPCLLTIVDGLADVDASEVVRSTAHAAGV